MAANETAHRIILLNFSSQDADLVAKAGYNVERGFAGVGHETWLPFRTPHPMYEYDILFYNSYVTEEMEKEFLKPSNGFAERGFKNTMSSFNTPPHVRVSFIGKYPGINFLLHGGVPFVKLAFAEQNISVLREIKQHTWKIDDLHETLLNLKADVSSVGEFFWAEDSDGIWNVPVLVTRDGHWVMGYGTTYSERGVPKYVVLPKMKRTAHAVIEILRCLEDLVPTLFPDKRRTDWLESEEFLLPEEISINSAIAAKVDEAERFIEAKQAEKKVVAEQNSFVRSLLVAKEDPALPPDRRLSGVVRSALEFLEFEVEDIDQRIKSAIKKEDFWVSDGKFLAITEVTGTVNKNPKVKEFNDILGRMMTLYRRQSELVLPAGKDIGGLLVLNYDLENHPSNRPRPYTGTEAHITDTAVEQNIGILSSVELHKIIMAVKKGELDKAAARELLKKPGRIEYKCETESRPRAS